MRTGVIARKLGMTRVYTEDGTHIPVTVMHLEGCQVTGLRTLEQNGYSAVQLGAGARKTRRTNKAMRGQFAKANVEPKAKLVEFRVSPENLVDLGAEISAKHFLDGQHVDVTGITIGKGFAGGMKRHNFGGLRATHGVSISHRSHGSTGQCQDPGKVFKGKKMAGHMGARRRTIQNLEVVSTDEDRGLILLKGAVPGPKSGWVLIKDAVKRATPDDVPLPAAILDRQASAADEGTEARADDTGFGEVVDRIVLIDGIGPKTEEALAAEGLTKLTELVALSAEDRSALFDKIRLTEQAENEEWVVQAEEMIDGQPPRAKVDQELAEKLRAGAEDGADNKGDAS